ncbi:hypothetical protein LWI28_001698 [Acer negundo]|uniref:Uncharacterized protein n=1 Tax=Acer negundo TaxID=4023 RepID=A0AAD5NMS2_ACENE|nr:hypothetical protein LWI28_001698 [Acer negundo]
MDAYLHILRKRQRYYTTVYGPRINILDSQFYSWLLNDWERLMGSGADKPRHSWSMFKHQWSADDLKVVRGLVPAGTKPWNEVDVTGGTISPWENAVHLLTIFFTVDAACGGLSSGNCGAHTLRLIEYLAANRDTFDWSENEMGTIREKMAVEVFWNSKDWSSS